MKKVLIIILSCLLLVACHSKNDQKNIIDIISDNNETIYKDNEKIIFKLDDIAYIFYYKDDTITDFEMYSRALNEEAVKAYVEDYSSKYLEDDNVDYITSISNYLIINYSDSYIKEEYEDMSSNDLINMFSYFSEEN